MTTIELGILARQKRKELKLNQLQLAEKAQVAQPTISAFELGKDVGANAMDKILLALELVVEVRFPRN